MNTQSNVQGPMQAAIHAANILAEQKKNNTEKEAVMPAIVPRKDLLGNRVLFLADTQSKEGIFYWDGKKGSKPQLAPIEFYRSTKPLDTQEEVVKFVQDYSKEFGVKNVSLRQRLIKSSVLERDDSGKVEKDDVDAFKEKLKAAIMKAIDEA